jgi:hypothetical protein
VPEVASPLDPFFTQTERGLEPSAAACGPWAPDMMHGRLLAGLAAMAIERDHGADGFVPTRLTVDLFRNPPMEPVAVAASLVRGGGRVRAMDALVSIGGVDVARASALWLRRSAAPDDDDVPTTPAWDAPGADTLLDQVVPDAAFDVVSVAGRGFDASGPRQIWVRDRRALVAGEALTPFVRTALVADIASPLANFAAAGLDYINADLTLHLGRLPVGEWIGAETIHRVAAYGVSSAVCALHDAHRPIGTSTVCAVRNQRLAPMAPSS